MEPASATACRGRLRKDLSSWKTSGEELFSGEELVSAAGGDVCPETLAQGSWKKLVKADKVCTSQCCGGEVADMAGQPGILLQPGLHAVEAVNSGEGE